LNRSKLCCQIKMIPIMRNRDSRMKLKEGW
jgi:hypothetical protein